MNSVSSLCSKRLKAINFGFIDWDNSCQCFNAAMLFFFSKASWVLERQHCWTTSSRTLRFAVQDGKPLKDVTARNKRRRRSQLLRTSLVRLDVNSFFPLGTTLGNKYSSNQMYTVTYLVVRFQLMMHCWCKRNWPWQRRQRLQSCDILNRIAFHQIAEVFDCQLCLFNSCRLTLLECNRCRSWWWTMAACAVPFGVTYLVGAPISTLLWTIHVVCNADIITRPVLFVFFVWAS